MSAIIEIEHLRKSFGENEVLKDINMNVNKGEVVTIIGSSGSGKSTLAKTINGLLLPAAGTIKVGGKELNEANVWDIRRMVGMVFQNPDNQFVGSTVEDDVAFGLENQGIPRDEMVERVHDALERVRMLDFAKREPARLSGGQKQRVAIAGVVALRPDIIILDEATSMLDPEGREDLMAVMRELQKKFQLTIISITHDLTEIALSDRTLVFQKGKLESSMTPRELFSRNDLNEIGLDKPFSKQVQESLSSHFPLKQDYLTESELLDQLWESL